MCHEKPCFTTVCGLPLKTSVLGIGLLELVITVIATALNVVKFVSHVELFTECEDKDVCVGPLIKYTVFDAFFGALCGILLILGSLQKSLCILVTWMVLTVVISVKYILVVLTHDWSSLEDWISIGYLFFTTIVFSIIWCFLMEIKNTSDEDGPAKESKQTPKGELSLTLNKAYKSPTKEQQRFEVKTPEDYPGRHMEPMKKVRSRKIIQCVTHNGITKCFARSTRETTRLLPDTFTSPPATAPAKEIV